MVPIPKFRTNGSAPVIRWLVWLYFFLWVFEGALRFWVFPELANQLLIVRDPVALLIYVVAFGSGVVPLNGFVLVSLVLGVLSFSMALVFGHGNTVVALYGVRAAFLHLPLIFVIPQVWRREDLTRFGKTLLVLVIPMAVLVVWQFRSPQGNWINLGGMITHYGTVRPSGTFSFVSGMVCFASLVTAFVAHAFGSVKEYGLLRILAAAAAALACVAVSGSRSMVFSVAIIVIMFLVLSLTHGKRIGGVVVMLGVAALAFATVSSTEFYEEGQQQLRQRFEDASGGGGIWETSRDRFLSMFTDGFAVLGDAGAFGMGIGAGTNAGARLLTGQRGFLTGETEWMRVILEMGPLVGVGFLLMRLLIAWRMLACGFAALRAGSLLPLLLFGAAGIPVIIGQWGVPSNQGFATFAAGMVFASAKVALERVRRTVDARGKVRKLARHRRPLVPPGGKRLPRPPAGRRSPIEPSRPFVDAPRV